MPVLVPELADTCVVINGVAKTYAMTGWRVGWMIGPADVIAAAANLQSHATSNVCNVAQRAALAAVSGDLAAVAEMRATYDRRRRTIVGDAQRHPGRALPRTGRGLLRLPEHGGTAGPAARAAGRPPTVARAGGPRARRGQGGVRARARRSAPPGTPASPTPSATRPWSRASPAWPSSSAAEAGMARVLVTEEIAEPGLALLRAAGHQVDVSLGLSAAELLAGHPGRRRPDHPFGHPGDRRGAGGRAPTWWWSAGPASASTTSTWPRPPAGA